MYLHNPWLSYGIGIHRMREAGLGTDLLDMLDEKPFSLEEIRKFCVEFFLGKDALSIRNPSVDTNGFFEDLQAIVDKEKLVWNPLKNKLCPWINVEKLKVMAKRNAIKGQGEKPKAKSKLFRRVTSVDPPEAPKLTGLSRSVSLHSSIARDNNQHVKKVGLANPDKSPKDLDEALNHWSRMAPSYKMMKPLEVLLVDAPVLFPPTNRFVESHEHFFKWKPFSEDAFIGEKGDELNALLKRACRKSKLFLHPDKLPSDLTPNQDTLFRAMWDTIQELEAKMA